MKCKFKSIRETFYLKAKTKKFAFRAKSEVGQRPVVPELEEVLLIGEQISQSGRANSRKNKQRDAAWFQTKPPL